MAVTGMTGEFLAVTPVADDDGACATTMHGTGSWALTFHVERACDVDRRALARASA